MVQLLHEASGAMSSTTLIKWPQLLLLLLVSSSHTNGASYSILGIFPTFSPSHHITGSALMRGLAAAGHNVTVISAFPMKNPPPRYRDIAVHGIKELVPQLIDLNERSPFLMPLDMIGIGALVSNHTLSHPRFQQFLADPSEKFDLIVLEASIIEALLGLGVHFNAPVIGYSTFGTAIYTNDMVGTPTPLSYVPHPFLPLTDRMTFAQRAFNVAFHYYEELLYRWHLQDQERLYRKYFPGTNKPPLAELRRNVALVLLNTHHTLGAPRPYVPNMIEVGGLHINREAPRPLPASISEFVEGADEHGVIYFSLGSNVRSSVLPAEQRAGILRALGSLKQRVLWKWDLADLPGKPDNVMISQWFPQDDVLAHPKVRLFITHGGLLSTTEAVYHGVPLVGIPVFLDQMLNMERAKAAGYAQTVRLSNLTETSLRWAVNEVLDNEKYTQKARLVSQRYRDQPMTPLETGVYWVEYVARHGGAKHLHSAGQDLEWWQYHNVDVYAGLAGVLLVATLFIVLVLKRAIVMLAMTDARPGGIKAKKN